MLLRKPVTRLDDQSMNILHLKANKGLGFAQAQTLALGQAGKHSTDPMILAWLDRSTGRHSPDVDCCQEDGKESWEIYAESRGGSLRIEVGERYVFIFRKGLQ